MKSKYSHVIWDWNGTLFNDVNWCIDVMNVILKKRGLNQLCAVSEYQKVFCYPIVQYLKNVGLDLAKESFKELAKEYICLYHSENSGNCKLFPHVEAVLKAISDKQISQIILSASQMENVLSQISQFEINGYFDEILGISDIYAKSKIETGLDYLARNKVRQALVIGDTEHDYETAEALGADCLLIANGHQSKEKLISFNVPVLEDITYVLDYIR